MRPGSISLQYRNPRERKTPFYQINYAHRMKSRTGYLRREDLKAVQAEVTNFRRVRKLIDQWAAAPLELSRLKTSLRLHADDSGA